jgi:GT2 family glycosyltransferase
MDELRMLEKRIAVLITCFNRKEKTLQCLKSVFEQHAHNPFRLTVFLVDDGSSDGTSDAVKLLFPSVMILSGDGSLFWAGGMRKAWKEALKSAKFDFFWLVNDDTVLYPNALEQLLNANEHALSEVGVSGIYSGSTLDPLSKKHSYGGEKLISPSNYAAIAVVPNGSYQTCEFLNANILFVPASVVEKIGIFSEVYIQSIADYDYSMRACRAGLPTWILPEYVGTCEYDHSKYEEGAIPPLEKRFETLFGAKGYSYKEFLFFVRVYFPQKYINTVVSLWFRTLFPRIWRLYKR